MSLFEEAVTELVARGFEGDPALDKYMCRGNPTEFLSRAWRHPSIPKARVLIYDDTRQGHAGGIEWIVVDTSDHERFSGGIVDGETIAELTAWLTLQFGK